MAKTIVMWPDDVDEVIAGDLTVALGCVTRAGGVVVTGVAPCGLRDRARGQVGFTTSLAFGKKLEHIIRNPRTALAYHTREHGLGTSPRFVLVDGVASADLQPQPERLRAFVPQVVDHLGPVKEGPVWDRLLRQYYQERVFVDIAVHRVTAWPDLGAAGEPVVHGAAWAKPPAAQKPPRNGTGPRLDVDKAAGQIASLPHRLLGYRGRDGYPVVVPVELAGHDRAGLRLVAAPGVLPPGARRAGLLAHAYRPHLVGLSTRSFTGWLEVDDDGSGVYAPHTTKGFLAPPQKNLLLVSNGLFAKYGLWKARRDGVLERLESLRAEVDAARQRAAPS
jgi:hypothetical protein